jgi:hypothetical protein
MCALIYILNGKTVELLKCVEFCLILKSICYESFVLSVETQVFILFYVAIVILLPLKSSRQTLLMAHASMPSEGLARIKNVLYFDAVSARHAEVYDSVRPLTCVCMYVCVHMCNSSWFLPETTGRIFIKCYTTPISGRYI